MRIVNLKKFVFSVFLVLMVILVVSLFISKSTLSHTETSYKVIYVAKGDTLWSIAKEEVSNNDYYSGKDIRDVVDNIGSLNNLYNSNLKIGDELKIPTL